MSIGTPNIQQFDEWIENNSIVAALVMRQWLESVEGADAVIFPPTYPLEQNSSGYNIDRFEEDGTNVCQIDSVGSQANRMEPIFKKEGYKHLIPQVIIESDEGDLHILDAGHRAADAIVRFSTPLNSQLYKAFSAIQKTGDAESLARIAPTSLVFGVWDSRATQAKLPRIVRSVIRAFNVKELHRSAQYSTIAGQILEGGEADTTEKGAKAELGLTHVPAVKTHGGVVAEGGIRRDAVLNLIALRSLDSTKDTHKLRRYILGLCLVALTAPHDMSLREGCHLISVEDRPAQWKVVRHDGKRSAFDMTHKDALDFAKMAADDFAVKQEQCRSKFDGKIAQKFIKMQDATRKKRLKEDPETWT